MREHSDKILVAYSARTGSTKDIAETSGKILTRLCEDVDVTAMQNIKDLKAYRAVVAERPIRAGKWLPEATEFIKTYKNDLNRRPFAAFLVCMTLAMKKGQEYRPTVSDWLDPVRYMATPVYEGLFPGIPDIKKITAFSGQA